MSECPATLKRIQHYEVQKAEREEPQIGIAYHLEIAPSHLEVGASWQTRRQIHRNATTYKHPILIPITSALIFHTSQTNPSSLNIRHNLLLIPIQPPMLISITSHLPHRRPVSTSASYSPSSQPYKPDSQSSPTSPSRRRLIRTHQSSAPHLFL